MQQKFSLILVIFLSINLYSCRSAIDSESKEAPDKYNAPNIFGIGEKRWDELRNILKPASTVNYWSDSYWPYVKIGLADRWAISGSKILNEGQDLERYPASPFEQISNAFNALTKNKDYLSALSPAEKHDLFGETVKPTEANLAELQKEFASLEDSGLVKKLFDKYHELTLAYDELNELYQKQEELYELHAKLTAMIEREKSKGKKRELEYELKKIAEKELVLEKSKNLIEDEKIPKIKNEGEAYYAELSRLIPDKMPAMAAFANSFPMTINSWATWLKYVRAYKSFEDWSWMGHCNGWASASLHYPAPKHGVMAIKNEKKVFFSEGDIRALLTKMWTDDKGYSDAVRFGGRRCNRDELEYNYDNKHYTGRIYDGYVCTYSEANSECNKDFFTIKNELTPQYSPNVEILEVLFEGDKKRSYAVLKKVLSQNSYKISLHKNLLAASIAAKLNKEESDLDLLVLQKPCRDSNPMLLHLALTELVAKGQGVIIDITHTSQVWNQPVFDFEIEFPTMLSLKKEAFTNGDLANIVDIEDHYKEYRANGTKFLLQVVAKVKYGEENGPLYKYMKEDEKSNHIRYVYSLEFDKEKKLIGGEWGWINSDIIDQAAEYAESSPPDFIWYIPENFEKNSAKKADYNLNETLIHNIHSCSIDEVTEKKILQHESREQNIPILMDLPYVECPI
ncbi:MAG: hypothetical protein KBD78_04710 [Oligoflexales bacterium]|nr:hypothetical protein [Oligoflexales bacterium]